MTKILVVIDPEETKHSALDRIREIPTSADVQFKVDYYIQPEPTSAELASTYMQEILDKKAWLNMLIKPYRDLGYDIEGDVQVFERLHEAIVQSALKYKADFLFKPLRKHGVLQRTLFTATDWNLVRFCPCPLLLVNHSNSLAGHPVVAAVDLASKDKAHFDLNQVVLAQTKILADLLSSDIHLAHAYNTTALPSGNAATDPLAYQINKGRRDEQFDRAYKLADSSAVPRQNVHLGEGTADRVVNKCASEIEAGIIVVGTVARSGFNGLFIGNTAESLMEHARSDVFVVKQEGFESPIKAA